MSQKSPKKLSGQTIALTGGSGFLGNHLLNSLLNAGHTVQALTRSEQADRDGVTWVNGSLSDAGSLHALCKGADTLIHVAGLVKALSRDDFFDANVAGSKLVLTAAAKQKVSHVLHISSLAAREPRLSHYGASKAAGELLLTARKWPFNWTVIRPPAIYGPGDMEILKLLKATRFGLLPAPGSVNNRSSWIHVEDLAEAITQLCDGSHSKAIVEIDDTKAGGYRAKDIAKALAENTKKPPKIFSIPFWVLGTIGAINGMVASALNRPAMLTLSTARYLCHPDWTVREPRRPKLPNWSPHYDLKAGLRNTVDWYKKNGLL